MDTAAFAKFNVIERLYLKDDGSFAWDSLITGLSLTSILGTLHAPLLQHITVVLTIQPNLEYGVDGLDEFPEWQMLDELLTSGAFPSLYRLMVLYHVRKPIWFDVVAGEIALQLERCLPLLVARGIVRFRQVQMRSNRITIDHLSSCLDADTEENSHKIAWDERYVFE